MYFACSRSSHCGSGQRIRVEVVDPSEAPPAPPAVTSPCFASSATIELADGAKRRIDTLATGDRILAATADGSLTYDVVSSFSLAQRDVTAAFVELWATSRVLALTPTHHLPVGSTCCTILKQAKDVHIGETVWSIEHVGGSRRILVPQNVTHVGVRKDSGLHNPLMRHGSFPLVDGVVTSYNSYPTVARNALFVPIAEVHFLPLARCLVAIVNSKTMRYIDGVVVEPMRPILSTTMLVVTSMAGFASVLIHRHLFAHANKGLKDR